jgi:hypothetical protein
MSFESGSSQLRVINREADTLSEWDGGWMELAAEARTDPAAFGLL